MQNTVKTKIRTISRYIVAAVILTSLACLVNFISASSSTAKSYNALPMRISQKPLVEKIVEHRDFFNHLNGYDEDLLCDVNDELGEEKIGLLLLEPTEILKSLVFNQNTIHKIHEEASIPSKKLRADLASSAVLISDARLIARNIAGLRTESKKKSPRRKTPPHETPRREAMPQSLPEGFAPIRDRKKIDTRETVERLRREVENNTELAAATSEEILERLRLDVQRKKEAKPTP